MLGQLIDWLMSQAAKRPSARSSEAPSQKKKKKQESTECLPTKLKKSPQKAKTRWKKTMFKQKTADNVTRTSQKRCRPVKVGSRDHRGDSLFPSFIKSLESICLLFKSLGNACM